MVSLGIFIFWVLPMIAWPVGRYLWFWGGGLVIHNVDVLY